MTTVIASLLCSVIWTDSWSVNAPQYPGMTGEVKVEVCVEGGEFTVRVDKRTLNGESERPWVNEVKKCWADGKESYCEAYP